MEETDFLSDLLECSVCFEQLNIQSKVLPCQHTFCKSCLEGIVVTHKELRCPECRVLVETKVSELPSNILLIRLLDGIKNNNTSKLNSSNRKTPTSSPQQQQDLFQISNQTPIHARLSRVRQDHGPNGLSIHDGHQRSISLPKQFLSPQSNLPRAKALFNYDGKEDCDLSFKKGDMIILRKRVDPNWYQGEFNGKHGFFPTSYVQVVVPLPVPPPPQCKALYDFRVLENEEKDCLTFMKSDVITVMRRVDDNWAEGKIGDRIGIFPISFVEMNTSAKALMKLASFNAPGTSRIAPPTPILDTSATAVVMSQTKSKQQQPTSLTTSTAVKEDSNTSSSTSPSSAPCTPLSTSSSSSSLSPNACSTTATVAGSQNDTSKHHVTKSVLSSLTTSNTLPLSVPVPETSQHTTANVVDGQLVMKTAGNYNKRHSLCAPASSTTANMGFPTTHHHRSNSHHIDDSAHRRSMEILSDRSSAAPDVVSSNWPLDLARNVAMRNSCRLETSLMGARSVYSPPSAPLTYYVALFNYKPQKNDELELRKSEVYLVTEKCQDGWYKGNSLKTGASGVFPGNYVTISKSALPQLSSVLNSSNGQRHPTIGGNVGGIYSIPLTVFQDGPPPLRPKTIVASSYSNASTSCSTVYARPRPSTLSTSVHGSGVASNLLDWARSIAPPARPPKGSACSSPARDLSPTDSSSTPSTPSPQWHPVRVAATRNAPANHSLTATSSNNSTASSNGCDNSEKKDTKEKRMSLMKRWTKKKSKSPPPTSSFYCDNPTFVDTSPRENVVLANPGTSVPSIHVRSGSCPSEALGGGSYSQTSEMIRNKQQPAAAPFLMRERFRCIVPYPPNSEYELPLEVGDIVYVHKKRDDGWFKGTLQRTGKSGLFPSSFVEAL